MVNWLNGLLYGAGGILATCMVLLVTMQEKLVYVPVIPGMSKGYQITPARLRLKYEDIWLTAEDGVRLHSWFIKLQPAVQDLWMSLLPMWVKSYNLILSRECWQYGDSDGFPSQHGLTMDAQAALDHLLQRTDIDPTRIVVFGRSLGGAVGSALVANNPGKISALILENTFTSVLDMAGVMLPLLKYVIGGTGSPGLRMLNFLVRSPWSTIDIVSKIENPILFLSGLRDEMVPPSHMRRLYDAAQLNADRQLIEFPNGMHMDTWLKGGDRSATAAAAAAAAELSLALELMEYCPTVAGAGWLVRRFAGPLSEPDIMSPLVRWLRFVEVRVMFVLLHSVLLCCYMEEGGEEEEEDATDGRREESSRAEQSRAVQVDSTCPNFGLLREA
ncbi:hypothetical protein AXG93_4689s1430 [Marchantia polymorpha subsp. ruderalis]|uniref:Peptidase S9 prolyl oligopeptidase catalytic domain-containing protein n=1 Tax=Marchantia polymorpha subsp. ruderalis TaxID=1480154 RepID=A0A176WN36_MARPO|nr:hypothetical protein AXG93_4689s1430 [Marchantia polymorpha subsp. ruderalis]